MSGENYENCFPCEEFGFRSRESFKKSSSIIEEKYVITELLSWLTSRNLVTCFLKDGIIKKENLPTVKQIEKKLSEYSKETIHSCLNEPTNLYPLAWYVCDVCDDILGKKSLNEWEYLDVACGNAVLSRIISENLQTMTRVTDIKDNRPLKKGLESYEEFCYIKNDTLDYCDNSFKVITCFSAFHHMKDPKLIIKEIYRILMKGGILLIKEFDCRDWNISFSLDFMHRIMCDVLEEDSTGVVSYRPREKWIEMILSCGFIHVESDIKKPKKDFYSPFYEVFQKH